MNTYQLKTYQIFDHQTILYNLVESHDQELNENSQEDI